MKFWITLTFGALFVANHPSGAKGNLVVTGIASLEECFEDADVKAAVESCAAPVLEELRADIEELGEYEYLNANEACQFAQPSFVDVVGCLADCAEFSCQNDTDDLLSNNPELFGITFCPDPLQDCVNAFNPAPAIRTWTLGGLLAAMSAMVLNLK